MIEGGEEGIAASDMRIKEKSVSPYNVHVIVRGRSRLTHTLQPN